MKDKFGKLMWIDLRKIWENEARDFSPWIASNIGELGKVLGMEFELIDTEAEVGEFSFDILAKDLGTGQKVIIENQFGPTDHDHMGKIITYAKGFDVSTVIWIAESIREEHRQALEWLNQRTDTDTQFFGIVMEVIQVDDSRPAYNFRPVVFPNKWQKVRRISYTSPKMEAYRHYFQDLIDELREKHRFTSARFGKPRNWYSFASGFSGAIYGASFARGGRVRVELYIGYGDVETNKTLFDRLAESRIEIESDYGSELYWERLDEKIASRIAIYREGSIKDDKDALTEYHNWTIMNLLKFKQVFGHRIDEIREGS